MATMVPKPNPAVSAEDLAYQEYALQRVSRTFALTIPVLPPPLNIITGTAYLLCRIADTIEDTPGLGIEEKRRYYSHFADALAGGASPAEFGRDFAARINGAASPEERDLIAHTERVIRIAHSFSPREQAALLRCVRIMAEGMERFGEGPFKHGLRDMAHLDAYCYHVAGVVGEMLTELFCAHDPLIESNRARLEPFAVSFGQGLQMTNILKDIWDDRARGVCWLPRSVFDNHGFDLDALGGDANRQAFHASLGELIAVTRGHLDNALTYTLGIPRAFPGIRQFCLWALGMAILTLRKVNRRRDFTSGAQVKISRRSVRATVILASAAARHDTALKALYALAVAGLPKP